MFKKSIAFKLTLGFVVIVLISMLTIGNIFINMFRQYTFENHQKTMLNKAHSVSDLLSESQANGFMHGFGSLVHSLGTLAEANIWITDSSGNPVDLPEMGMGMGMGKGMYRYWSNESEPLPEEAQSVINDVLSGKESVSQSFSSLYNEATVTVGVPIFNSSKRVIGSVLLHSPVTGITATLNKSITILLISLFAALILSLCMGVFYSLFFTRPLKAMNITALEMTRGNYAARTGVNREDEIGQLGVSLDLLASELGLTIDQLFQEKGKMSDMIASISEGIIALDLNFDPVRMNASLSAIMHHGLPYPLETMRNNLDALNICSEFNEVVKEKTTIHIKRDWEEKKLDFTLSPIINSSGTVTGVVALVQDISERERLDQLRKDFVANVSHEFRTPLTVIRGSLEAIMDGTIKNQEDTNRYHQRMLSEVRGLERLVGDLLDLSRLQSGNISMNKDKLHIPDLLNDAVKSVQTYAIKKEIRINSDFPLNIPPVLGDYDRLRQLFIIFLDNAIKYSPEKTLISVQIVVSQTLDIIITDQGYGIEKEELSSIWNRFYQSDKSRKSDGTGLGLAIARQLAALHDATLYMDSELSKGTTITIKLPILK